MLRMVLAGVSVLALGTGVAAAADLGDFDDGFRGSYPAAWSYVEDSPLRFEAGLRYWYSWGGQKVTTFGGPVTRNDRAHAAEVHMRIDDLSTQTYLKGHAGSSVAISGDYSRPGASGTISDGGRVTYAALDLGYQPLGDMASGTAGGGFVGYQYWNDSPDIGRANYVTALNPGGIPSAGSSNTHAVDVHALRLGVSARADLSDMFDIQAEVAAIPYAYVNGTLADSDPTPFISPPLGGVYYQSSPTSVSGHAYGASAEVMLGIRPADNVVLRLGGRAMYLQGELDSQYTAISTGGTQGFIGKSSFSQFRYGLMAELSASF